MGFEVFGEDEVVNIAGDGAGVHRNHCSFLWFSRSY